MKKFTFAFIVVSTLLLNACKKDDTVSASNLSAGHSKVSLTAAGATSGNFSSTNDLISIVAKSGAEINLSASYVNTTSFTTEIVLMLLPADITTGSYNFKTMSSSAALPTFAYTKGVNGWAATPSESEFTIVVSKATSTEIEGTFSGTLHNDTDNTDVTISNGKFAAKY
jgi:major membrane immunogen (membrane-anchored lipoprotein)